MSPEKRLSAEERRQAIVDSALPLFAERGFMGTTTRDIAQAAGVSEALLYRHFPSKEVLYSQIQGACCQSAMEAVDKLSQLPPSTSSLIMAVYFMTRSIVHGGVTSSSNEEHRTFKRLMLRSLCEDGKFAKTFLAARNGEWVPILVRLFDAAEEQGDLVPSSGTHHDRMWLGHHLSVGLSIFLLPGKPVVDYDEESLTRLTHQTVEFILRGIGVKPEAIERHYNPEAFDLMLGSHSNPQKGDNK